MDRNDDYDNYEELTPEELEQERRRKAMARRARHEAKEQRRKKRRQQAIIRCTILGVAVLLVLFILVKIVLGIAGHFGKDKGKDKDKTEAQTTEEVIATIDDSILAKEVPADVDAAIELISKEAETSTDYQCILDNSKAFSNKMTGEDILRYVAVNPEMTPFAIDYLAKIDIAFEGNFTVDVSENEVPLFLQYDERWGYADYGSHIIGLNGSGPCCLAMAYTYLKQDGTVNPIKAGDMAMDYGYLTENGSTADVLMTEGANKLGLNSEEISIDKDTVVNALKSGKLIICAVTSGDFTKTSEYIVIKEYRSGLFLVNDPTSEARSSVGWDFTRLSGQIAKMWALEDSGQPMTVDLSGESDTSNNDAGEESNEETEGEESYEETDESAETE